ncbi:hypothetical protein DPMN_044441 [Dreissena polymorpha]|uniref:Uncharacterized protein n=2 Tax=Dreissena polymorpha TaxID=45954 RepID=A0A9D4HYR1_DREPO|nr:hypothetical protein DPMN_044441 [Dreissena polymorpha]
MILTNSNTPVHGFASLLNVDSSHRFAISFDSNSWPQNKNYLHIQIGHLTHMHYYVENPLAGQPGCLMISVQEENMNITCYASPNVLTRMKSVNSTRSEEIKPWESPIVVGLSATGGVLGLICTAVVVIVVFKYRRRNTNAISRKSVVYDIPDDGGVLYTDDSPALNNSSRLFRRGQTIDANSNAPMETVLENPYATINDEDDEDDNVLKVETRHGNTSQNFDSMLFTMPSEETSVKVYAYSYDANDTPVRNCAAAVCKVEQGTMYITCVDRTSASLPCNHYAGHIAHRCATHEERVNHTTDHLGESNGYLHVVYKQ